MKNADYAIALQQGRQALEHCSRLIWKLRAFDKTTAANKLCQASSKPSKCGQNGTTAKKGFKSGGNGVLDTTGKLKMGQRLKKELKVVETVL